MADRRGYRQRPPPGGVQKMTAKKASSLTNRPLIRVDGYFQLAARTVPTKPDKNNPRVKFGPGGYTGALKRWNDRKKQLLDDQIAAGTAKWVPGHVKTVAGTRFLAGIVDKYRAKGPTAVAHASGSIAVGAGSSTTAIAAAPDSLAVGVMGGHAVAGAPGSVAITFGPGGPQIAIADD